MRVLITRPQPEAARTAAALKARGHAVLAVPLMKVKPVEVDVAGNWSAAIVTSSNALHALTPVQRSALSRLPLFAVGRRSAETAREVGFTDVRSAEGDARDLVRLIVLRMTDNGAPMLYLAGEDSAFDLAGELSKHKIAVHTEVVYRAVTTGFPPELIAALEAGAIDVALHFSRRSAENYLAGAKSAGLLGRALLPRQCCLSAPVAEPLIAAGAKNVTVAKRPDEAALLELADRA